jgi:hypothetical protein
MVRHQNHLLIFLNIDLSGVISLIDKNRENGELTVNILFNYIPVDTLLKVKLMEYGDFSSLIVEYPDYNSLGKVMKVLHEFQTPKYMVNEA